MRILQCVASVAAATGIFISASTAAQAQQKFPTKPIRLVVSFGLGGPGETLARTIGPKLSESWGQPVIVENRVGAGGTLAASAVAKATPDGHTLLYTGSQFAISAAMQPSLPYDPIKDFAGISRIGFGSGILVVASALGVKSVKELIALAKAQPGKIIFSSPNVGSPFHLTGARFNHAAAIKVVTVAFKGVPEAMVEVLAGRADYAIVGPGGGLPLIKDGRLLALAATPPQRLHSLPDVPSLAETFPEWKQPEFGFGLLAPAKTPPPILKQISKEVARIVGLPDVREWMRSVDITPALSTPEEHDKILREQLEIYSKLVRDIGLRPK